MKSEFFLLRVLFLCVSLSVIRIASGEEPEKIVAIGFAAPLTETPAQSARDAAQLAIDEVNARPVRINGTRIRFKLLEQDDKADVNFAMIAARYFIASKVVGVIGHWNTATSIATAKVYNDAQIAQLSPSATGSQYTRQHYQTSFRLIGHDGVRSGLIAAYALDTLKAQRIAVIDDGDIFGSGIAEQFIQYIKSHGGTIISRASVSDKTSDFSTALEKTSQAQADLVFYAGRLFYGHINQGAFFINGIKRLASVNNILLAETSSDPKVLQEAGIDKLNIFAISPGLPLTELARGKAFEKRYRERSDARITAYTQSSYDAVHVLVNAIERADTLAPAAIVRALHNSRHQGLGGMIAFDPNGDLINASYTVYQLKDSKWAAIKLIR
jgi:branched-chain amino acid transport system substrate-binding protein